MEKSRIWLVIGILAVIVLIFSLVGIGDDTTSRGNNGGTNGDDNGNVNNGLGDSDGPPIEPTTHTITMDSSGFSPGVLTIKAGDSVVFSATDSSGRWPASAIHPTHTVYPGSDIDKCGTSEDSTIFDSCGAVANGESWSFTFNEAGEWGYHDHLNPSKWGKIVVE